MRIFIPDAATINVMLWYDRGYPNIFGGHIETQDFDYFLDGMVKNNPEATIDPRFNDFFCHIDQVKYIDESGKEISILSNPDILKFIINHPLFKLDEIDYASKSDSYLLPLPKEGNLELFKIYEERFKFAKSEKIVAELIAHHPHLMEALQEEGCNIDPFTLLANTREQNLQSPI